MSVTEPPERQSPAAVREAEGNNIVQERIANQRIIFLGLSAVAVAAIVQAMSIEHPDESILVSVFCFSLSIPLTVSGGMIAAANIDLDGFYFRKGEAAFMLSFILSISKWIGHFYQLWDWEPSSGISRSSLGFSLAYCLAQQRLLQSSS
jgi:hypothetical protein